MLRFSLAGSASILVVLTVSLGVVAQSPAPAQTTSSAVPDLVSYSGVLKDVSGHILTSVTGVTFLIYQEEQGGAPLWLETQSVTPDKSGHYAVQLGSASAHGLPAELFQAGATRWLAMQVANEPEQPRTLLVAVPYAMKAADAETIGGLPASAFVRATPATGLRTNGTDTQAPPVLSKTVTTKSPFGTANYLPLWTGANTIQNSNLFQNGTGRVGIGTTTPAATLDVHGTGNFTGLITFAAGQTFPGTGTVTSVGLAAPPTDFSVIGSPVTTAGTLTLEWLVPPDSNDIANAIVKRDNNGNFSVTNVSAAAMFSLSSATNNLTVNNQINVPTPGASAITATSPDPNAKTIYGVATSNSNTTFPVAVEGDATGSDGTGVAGGASGSNGIGVFGNAPGTNGTGILGYAAGTNGIAVAGVAKSSSGITYGTSGYAMSANGYGVYGNTVGRSVTGSNVVGKLGAGAWGDSGPTLANAGVAGTADNGYGGYFLNSSAPLSTVWTENNSSTGYPFTAINRVTQKWCEIDNNGSLFCLGTKNAVVPIEGGRRQIALSAIESPKNWFEDFGSAQLVNGIAVVDLDADFLQTVNTTEEYQVFLTPYGDCKGLYVTNRAANSFEVHELGGGTASLSFGYRITALRKNYEKVRFEDHTADVDRMKQQLERTKPSAESVSHDPVRNPPAPTVFGPRRRLPQ